jgi:phytoene/squalene synthetase
MKALYDNYCYEASKAVTKKYSTSFYAGVKGLDRAIRADIHNIYGFVRFADEIVDSFHDFNKAELLDEFKRETFNAIERGISLNPILNSFQHTVNKYKIDHKLIQQFLHSMEMDLNPDAHYDQSTYEEYILGSAEVVGLMCLKVFVYGDEELYTKLKPYAMKLGSAFQKINFLRDLNADFNELGRLYFPNLEGRELTLEDKLQIENEIMAEFDEALVGIKMLPKASRFGVYVSYKYYRKLLKTIQRKTATELLKSRISVPNPVKMMVFAKSYVRNTINLL